MKPTDIYKTIRFRDFSKNEVPGYNGMVSTTGDGFKRAYGLCNQLNHTVFVYNLSGTLIATVPPWITRSTFELHPETLEISLNQSTLTDYRNKGTVPNIEKVGKVIRLCEKDLRERPVLVEDLDIIIATPSTCGQIKTVDEVLKGIFLDDSIHMANGEIGKMQPLILYGNFTGINDRTFYLAIDDSIVEIPRIQCDGMPQGCGYFRIMDRDTISGVQKDIRFEVNLQALLDDPDMVINHQKIPRKLKNGTVGTKYKLSASDEMLTTFLEKERNGSLLAAEIEEAGPDALITRGESDKILEARTIQLTDSLVSTQSMLDEERERGSALRAMLKESEATQKLTLAKLEEALDPETLEMRIEERVKQQKHKHTKTVMDNVKSQISVVSAVVGLVALVRNPLMTAVRWIGGLFGFFGAAAAAA